MLLGTFFVYSSRAKAGSTISDSGDCLVPQATQMSSVNSAEDVQISDSGDCIVPNTSNVSASGDTVTDDSSSTEDQTSVYVVRSGDSIEQIAKLFDVSVNTIRWANGLKAGDKLQEGDVLLILPVSGIEYTIKKGDTLAKIAKFYKADSDDIAQYNGITADSQLVIGDKVIVPDAEMSDLGGDKPVSDIAKSVKKDQDYYTSHYPKNVSGYFARPLMVGRLTQGLHDHYAVDIGAPKGTPIYSSAPGKVLFARTGWNGGYGNLVIINDSNGTQTYYAHQYKIAVSAGERVDQGELIGYVGSTGHSTGPHLHFEVRGAPNPALYWY